MRSFLTLLLCALLAGCAAPDVSFMQPPAELLGTRWTLTTLNGEAVAPVAEAKPPELEFRGDSTVQGFAGCNRISGRWSSTAADRITFAEMTATRMTCPTQKLEDDFLSALGATTHLRLKRTVLYLLATDTVRAVFEAR